MRLWTLDRYAEALAEDLSPSFGLVALARNDTEPDAGPTLRDLPSVSLDSRHRLLEAPQLATNAGTTLVNGRMVASPALTLLGQLTPEERKLLFAAGVERRYGFGQVIVAEGEPVDGLYVVTEGRARVVVRRGAQERVLAVLGPGALFGTAHRNERRLATVRATGPLTTVFVARDTLDWSRLSGLLALLADAQEQHLLRELLTDHPVVGGLPLELQEKLASALVRENISKGTLIFEENDPPGPLYLVRAGQLRATKNVASSPQRVVGYLKPPDLFGVTSAVHRMGRRATLEATSDVVLYALPLTALDELLGEGPELAWALEQHIARLDFDRPALMPLDLAEAPRVEAAQKEPRPSASESVEVRPGTIPAPTEDEPFKSVDGYFGNRSAPKGRFPLVYQIDQNDCGAASLAMVCRHYGRKVSLGRIRALLHTGADGASLASLVATASALGLAARGPRASASNLDKLPLPAILHWQGHHWLVLVGLERDRARLADPASGERWVSRETLLRDWTGYAVLTEPTSNFEAAQEEQSRLEWVLPYLAPLYRPVALAAAFSTLAVGFTVAVPVATQLIVDLVLGRSKAHWLGPVILVATLTLLLAWVGRIMEGRILMRVAQRVDASISDRLTQKLLALPLRYFRERRISDVQQRLEGSRAVRELVVGNGVAAWLAALQWVAALITIAWYSPILLGAYLATLPLHASLVAYSSRRLRPLFGALEEAQARDREGQLEALRGMETLKAAAAEDRLRLELARRHEHTADAQVQVDQALLRYQNSLGVAGALASVAFLGLGAELVILGRLTVGGFVASGALVALASTRVNVCLALWERWQRARVWVDRLADVFDYAPEQTHAHLIPVSTWSGALELRGVRFRYGGPDSPLVLQKLDLKVSPGEIVAVVGKSGAGKTTLLKLLTGLVEPSEGSVLIDGVEQRLLDQRQLRQRVGLALQESHLFSGTVLENIALGAEPDLERATRAARLAHAHELITRLPQGYQARLGEGGVKLSSGQTQRIALARALYKDATVFVLDEATSALDSETERLVWDTLWAELRGRTIFLVSHRPEVVQRATKIVVLEQGEIVEVGSPEALAKKRGVYFELMRR